MLTIKAYRCLTFFKYKIIIKKITDHPFNAQPLCVLDWDRHVDSFSISMSSVVVEVGLQLTSAPVHRGGAQAVSVVVILISLLTRSLQGTNS